VTSRTMDHPPPLKRRRHSLPSTPSQPHRAPPILQPALPAPAPAHPADTRALLLSAPPTAVRIPHAHQRPFALLLHDLVLEALALPRGAPTSRTPLAFVLRLLIPAGATSREIGKRLALGATRDWAALAATPFPLRPTRDPAPPTDQIPDAPKRARHYMEVRNCRKALQALLPRAPPIHDYAAEVARLFPDEPEPSASAPPPPAWCH
jgi:hypothetical protein